jgi:site-specific DNA-methyltransferase (adenine-specific)
MEYKVSYKGYEFIITQNEDGSFNIPEDIRDIETFGTALKPAAEYIVMARKPLSEKSVAENVLKWGTGGINIDGCRVGSEGGTMKGGDIKPNIDPSSINIGIGEVIKLDEGRFPANLILECLCDEVIKGEKGERSGANDNYGDKKGGQWGQGKQIRGADYNDKGDIHTNPMCPCYMMDEQSGVSKARSKYPEPDISSMSMTYYDGKEEEKGVVKGQKKEQTKEGFSDKGGASRFFYQAKVGKAERNMGLDHFEDKEMPHGAQDKCGKCNKQFLAPKNSQCVCEEPERLNAKKKNIHPTVKPVSLMAYLVRLVTPPNGIVLDPFMGSGSTGIAAQLEGFRFVGMEMDKDYFKIAESRIENFESYRKFIK